MLTVHPYPPTRQRALILCDEYLQRPLGRSAVKAWGHTYPVHHLLGEYLLPLGWTVSTSLPPPLKWIQGLEKLRKTQVPKGHSSPVTHLTPQSR